jgi:hypothetical protein
MNISLTINARKYSFSMDRFDVEHSNSNRASVILYLGYENQNKPRTNKHQYITWHKGLWLAIFDNCYDAYDAISDGIEVTEQAPLLKFSK